MKKTPVRLLLAALVAVLAFGSSAQAASHKLHHRAKHSSRVTTSSHGRRHSARTHHRAARHTATRKHQRSTKPH